MKKRYALLLTGLLTLSLEQDVALRLTMQERLLHRRFLNHRQQRVQSRQREYGADSRCTEHSRSGRGKDDHRNN